VACDGGGGPLGHPRIFINTDRPQICWCTYCGLPYVSISDKHQPIFERMGLTTSAHDDRPTKRTKLISSHYLRPHTLLRRRATRTRFNCHPVPVRRERYRDSFRSLRVSMRRRVLPIHHLNRDDGRGGCGRGPQLYILRSEKGGSSGLCPEVVFTNQQICIFYGWKKTSRPCVYRLSNQHLTGVSTNASASALRHVIYPAFPSLRWVQLQWSHCPIRHINITVASLFLFGARLS
jgi:hypothetical protein